ARIKYWIFEFKEHNNVFCVVYDRSGKPLYRTEEMAAASVPSLSRIRAEDGPKFHEVTLPILGRQRAMQNELRAGDQEFVVILLASMADLDRERAEVERDQAEVEQEFRMIAFILVACMPFALLLVGIVGYWLARKSLAPI